MTEIIPAIMPKNYEDLKNKIAMVRGRVPLVQIDLCDGMLVRTITWPFNEIHDNTNGHFQSIQHEEEGMPFWEDIDFELDLMVKNAPEDFDTYLKLGAKRIVFHLEAMDDLEKFQEFVEAIDIYVRENTAIGVAIDTTTPVEKIFPLVPHIDYIQCMGIAHDGMQGEEFDERALDHIRALREKYPELPISVDGGVSYAIAQELLDAGATRLVSGSSIFESDDISGTIRAFKDL